MGRNRLWTKEWKRLARIALYALLLAAFLELSSAFVLNKVVDPTRMKRFDDLFFGNPLEREIPHPFLGYVNQDYLREQDRYLNRIGMERNETAYVVAMGGSTTEDGWPRYTETYLNDILQEMNAPLRVEVFNFGVSGWNTIHSIQNYVFITRFLHPDIIIFHHNRNDAERIHEDFFRASQQNTLPYPLIGEWERALLRGSRFYKLLRFAYLHSYNHVRYGKRWEHFIRTQYLQVETLPEVSQEFVLNESYGWLIRAAGSDNAALVMTTMYLNYSKVNYSKEADKIDVPWRRADQDTSDAINDLIRQASRQHNVTLVDLAEEMEPYDSLLDEDGVHWVEEGIRLKGELVGEAVFEVLKERYNLGSAQEGAR